MKICPIHTRTRVPPSPWIKPSHKHSDVLVNDTNGRLCAHYLYTTQDLKVAGLKMNKKMDHYLEDIMSNCFQRKEKVSGELHVCFMCCSYMIHAPSNHLFQYEHNPLNRQKDACNERRSANLAMHAKFSIRGKKTATNSKGINCTQTAYHAHIHLRMHSY